MHLIVYKSVLELPSGTLIHDAARRGTTTPCILKCLISCTLLLYM